MLVGAGAREVVGVQGAGGRACLSLFGGRNFRRCCRAVPHAPCTRATSLARARRSMLCRRRSRNRGRPFQVVARSRARERRELRQVRKEAAVPTSSLCRGGAWPPPRADA